MALVRVRETGRRDDQPAALLFDLLLLIEELRLAALLHDFGKITVDEDVLVKAKKLPPKISY